MEKCSLLSTVSPVCVHLSALFCTFFFNLPPAFFPPTIFRAEFSSIQGRLLGCRRPIAKTPAPNLPAAGRLLLAGAGSMDPRMLEFLWPGGPLHCISGRIVDLFTIILVPKNLLFFSFTIFATIFLLIFSSFSHTWFDILTSPLLYGGDILPPTRYTIVGPSNSFNAMHFIFITGCFYMYFFLILINP